MKKKIFLGGTCNDSTWRSQLIPLLTKPYFNPVVKDWNPEAQENEIREKENASCEFYCITPEMTGVFSIAEAVDCSNKKPDQCILCILKGAGGKTFTSSQYKSLKAVANLIIENGGLTCSDLITASIILNNL